MTHFKGGGASSRKKRSGRWRNALASGFLILGAVVASRDLGAQQTVAAPLKALVGGTLIDGFGGPPLSNSIILIRGPRIEAVGQVGSMEVPEGAEVISTDGMSVLPGLWDMHVHLMINGHADYAHWDKTYPPLFRSVIMPASALQLLRAGITSARDLGAPLDDILSIRDAINSGKIPDPRFTFRGPSFRRPLIPEPRISGGACKGPEDAAAKVQRLAEAGVDCIKLIEQDQMSMDELRAIVEEAHKHGLPVVAHAHRPEEILRGLAVGVDCFEHTGLATAPEYPARVVDMLRERTAQMNLGPLFWTPTIEGLFNYEYVRDHPEKLDDPSWKVGLTPEIIDDIRRSISHPGRLPYFQITPARRPTLARKFEQLRDSGVVLMIGTDSGIPMKFHSQSTWNELDVWVNKLGVPPMEAIRAATYWPSVHVGASREVGTVTEGKYADIIAVRGDVLRYISLLQDVDLVIKRGRRVR